MKVFLSSPISIERSCSVPAQLIRFSPRSHRSVPHEPMSSSIQTSVAFLLFTSFAVSTKRWQNFDSGVSSSPVSPISPVQQRSSPSPKMLPSQLLVWSGHDGAWSSSQETSCMSLFPSPRRIPSLFHPTFLLHMSQSRTLAPPFSPPKTYQTIRVSS
jgi:hypothetical protein